MLRIFDLIFVCVFFLNFVLKTFFSFVLSKNAFNVIWDFHVLSNWFYLPTLCIYSIFAFLFYFGVLLLFFDSLNFICSNVFVRKLLFVWKRNIRFFTFNIICRIYFTMNKKLNQFLGVYKNTLLFFRWLLTC